MIRTGLTLAAVAALFAAPYFAGAGWWRYLAADAGILAVATAGLGARAPAALGLRAPPRHLAAAAALFAATAAAGLAALAALESADAVAVVHHPDPRWRLFSVSQAFHQEIVLRALVLGGVRRWLGHDLAASLLVALAFVAVHAAFFTWTAGVALPPASLATLLAFALAGNELFLAFGHVAFSFALHAGWNVVRFGAAYRALPAGEPLGEAASFAAVEGAPGVLAGALLLLAACAAVRRRSRRARDGGGRPGE